MIRRPVIVPFLAAALALAACSSSTDGKPSIGSTAAGSGGAASGTDFPSPSATAPSSAAAPSTGSRGADLAAIVLHAGDVPAGWKPTPADPSSTAQDARAKAQLVACVGGTSAPTHPLRTVDSPDFDQGDDSISSNAEQYASSAEVDADVAVLTSPKVDRCYAALARSQLSTGLPAGTTVSSFSFHVTPGSGGGPAGVVATGSGRFAVEVQGQHVVVYEDVAFIRGKQVEAEVDFTGLGHRIAGDVRQRAIAAVATRAATA